MSKLKKFSNYISYLLDDIRDDWKHLIKKGPKRWLRGLFRDLRNSRDSLKDFKVRATAEVSEKEKRRIEKRRLKRRAERIQDMREGLRNLATLPWRLLVGTKKALKAFRKKGIRDGIADLWSGYVSWVMRGVGWFLGLWERFIKLPLWLRGFSATAIIIIIATACTLPWIFEEVQDRRAQEMLAQAREVQDTADLVEAYRKSRAAALMRPDDPEALELVLELSNSVGTPEAIWWSERVSSVRGQDAESMNRVVETALRHRRVEKAEQSFASMKARYPDDENIAEIEVELLIARNKQNEALRRALVALEAGEDSPFLHTTVVELGLKYSTSEFKQRIYEHLLENLYRDDEVGIALARLVFALGIGAPNGKEALLDYNQLISFIETHEQANAVDRAASYSLALRMGNIDRATAEDNILKQFDLEDKDELLTVVRGLGALGLYESYGRIIPEEFIAKEPDFALARITGLVFQNNPDLNLAEAMLSGTSEIAVAPISQAKKAFWKAVIADRKGDSKALALGIVTALEYASSAEWSYFMRNLPLVGGSEEIVLFYQELFERSGRNPLIASEYLRLAYLQGNEELLKQMIKSMPLKLAEHDPKTLSLLIFLKLLYDEDSLDESRYQAEKLVAEHPNDIGHLIGLAHVYARLGQIVQARRLINFWDSEGRLENLPPYLQLSYLTVTGKDATVLKRDSLPTAREKELLDHLIHTNLAESGRTG